jgi:hypothetical protein
MELAGRFRADHDHAAARDRGPTALKREPRLFAGKEEQVLAALVIYLKAA